MIERWFPCAQVSSAAATTWGRGKTEKGLFTWFAARPPAQAKAAVLCSLLPWPEDEAEQDRLQKLVIDAMEGRLAALRELTDEVDIAGQPSVLDPFSGRGMIPLEAAKLGVRSIAFDYSAVAVIASHLLTDFPLRDWSGEPQLPFAREAETLLDTDPRLLRDVSNILGEIGRRWKRSIADLYPSVDGRHPWGYLWAVTLPCEECGARFPLIGSYELRKPGGRRNRGSGIEVDDPGQSFYVESDDGQIRVVVHDGPPIRTPTLVNAVTDGKKIPGKSAICPHCRHIHPLATHRRLTNEGKGRDQLLVVADVDELVGKRYRLPKASELEAASRADRELDLEPKFGPFLSARPDEQIAPGNNNIIGPSIYGCRTYGDLMSARQTLSFVRMCRVFGDLVDEMRKGGVSDAYIRALSGYASAQLIRKVRYSSRGVSLHLTMQAVTDIFLNEGSIAFSYDFFETGIGGGPGSWESLTTSGLRNLRYHLDGLTGSPTEVSRGSATSLPLREASVGAVVTDPPYDQMIAYADSSDVFYVWLKRALISAWPELSISADPLGVQEKTEEIIVKRVRGEAPNEHRTREHYDRTILAAFKEMRRVVVDDGVVTIVFGHGEPEVWQRLLHAISEAGLTMTGSWPATTESGGAQGKANIQTTLTMSCRPAPAARPSGRKGAIESEIKAEIKQRYPDWERWGLAPADMLMAAAGPAMEVVGRYSEVLDSRGEQVDIYTFLPLARAAVQEAMAVEVDHRPLDTFDPRTRFALWWARLYGRQPQAKSELRWQALASSMDLDSVRDLVPGDRAVALVTSAKFAAKITPDSAAIDVALALAAASEQGTAAMGEVLAASQFEPDDPFLWAAIQFLADRLPDADPDSVAFHRVLRARAGIGTAAENLAEVVRADREHQDLQDRQIKLL